VLGRLVTLLGGAAEPFHRLGVALGHAATGLVTQPEIALGGGDLLFRRRHVPTGRLGKILRHHLAGLVKNTQVELRLGLALFPPRRDTT